MLDFLERSSVEGKLLAYAYIHEGLTCEVHPFHPTHLHRILLWTHPFDNSPQHALFPWNCWSRSPLFLRTTCLYIFSSFLYFSAINRLSRLKKAVLINIKTNLVIYKQERERGRKKRKNAWFGWDLERVVQGQQEPAGDCSFELQFEYGEEYLWFRLQTRCGREKSCFGQDSSECKLWLRVWGYYVHAAHGSICTELADRNGASSCLWIYSFKVLVYFLCSRNN